MKSLFDSNSGLLRAFCILCAISLSASLPMVESAIFCFCSGHSPMLISELSHCNTCHGDTHEGRVEKQGAENCNDVISFQYSFYERTSGSEYVLYPIMNCFGVIPNRDHETRCLLGDFRYFLSNPSGNYSDSILNC